ncbi:death on curing protein [Candidatus Methanophagaceae archaeon]|nr:death on curing protein [Methanophagales archaeon]
MNYKYLTKESIIRLHKKIVETTGGEKGMLNEGILSFILDLIRTEKLYSENIGNLFTRAGLLLRGIISGHPFVDGNKRAGFEATDVFLRMNGYYLEVGADEGMDFTLDIAKNELDLDGVIEWIRRHAKEVG